MAQPNSSSPLSLNKKTSSVTIRVTEEESKMLDYFAATLKMSKSLLIRNAATQYLTLLNVPTDHTLPKMLISQDLVGYMYEKMDLEDLNILAERTFRLGMEDDAMDKKLNPNPDQQTDQENFRFQLMMLTEYVFCQKWQHWFSKLKFSEMEKKKEFSLFGQHNMGKNFSIFFTHLMALYADHNNYQIARENNREGMIQNRAEKKTKGKQKILVETRKKAIVQLHFTPNSA